MENMDLFKELEAVRERVGQERDKLEAILAEAQDILDTVDRAAEALDEAIAALSELA
jgi:ABC-type transporter Mla subunit MlaD